MRKSVNKKFGALLLAIMLLGGCASGEKEKLPTPGQTMQDNIEPTGISLPEKLEISADGTPVLSVYQVDEEYILEIRFLGDEDKLNVTGEELLKQLKPI